VPLVALIVGGGCHAVAQSSGVADRPYLGWSSFSEQTVSSNFLTQTNIQAQSDALLSSGLQQHGFTYINIDAGWQGSFDSNGRPLPNASLFPDIVGLISHIHSNGQKAGIYWKPGVDRQAVLSNSQILGTTYHIRDILAVPNSAGDAFAASDPCFPDLLREMSRDCFTTKHSLRKLGFINGIIFTLTSDSTTLGPALTASPTPKSGSFDRVSNLFYTFITRFSTPKETDEACV
jgi:Alpha galactosidase A